MERDIVEIKKTITRFVDPELIFKSKCKNEIVAEFQKFNDKYTLDKEPNAFEMIIENLNRRHSFLKTERIHYGKLLTKYVDKISSKPANLIIKNNNQEPKVETALVKKDTNVIEIDSVSKRKPKRSETIQKVLTFNELVQKFNLDVNNKTIYSSEVIKAIKFYIDKTTAAYNYDSDHPMQGIGNGKIKKFRLQSQNEDTESDILQGLAEKQIKNITAQISKNNIPEKTIFRSDSQDNKSGTINEGLFVYQNNVFIYFEINNEILFDINQIIPILKVKDMQKIYNQHKEHINFYLLDKNEFGGYNLRELIYLDIVSEIIINSKCDLRNAFVRDISKILRELCKNQMMSITNDSIKLNNKLIPFIHPITKKEYTQICENKEIMNVLNTRLIEGKNKEISINNFDNKHCMYFIRICVKNDPRIICKSGYSFHVSTRLRELSIMFNTKIELIDVKTVMSQNDEVKFHQNIKLFYPELCYVDLDGKYINECYVFDVNILTFFDKYTTQCLENQNNQDNQNGQQNKKDLIEICKALTLNNKLENDQISRLISLMEKLV